MHERFMKLAIKKAKEGKGKNYTNPLVGAVIVKNNKIIATGLHLSFGENHAEKNAILSCQSPEKLLNSTLYVTLEPCHHFGKQPPCTKLILESGIKSVVIGQLDPNPLVSGKGKKFLEENGIQVITNVLQSEVEEINEQYNTFYKENRPFISLKQAITLDGKIAINHKRTALTSKEMTDCIRQERGSYHGILVGSETILIDNPTLLANPTVSFQPIRIILDRRGRVIQKPELEIFNSDSSQVLIFTQLTEWQQVPNHVEIISQRDMTIFSVLEELAKRNIQSLYVEGGATIHDIFLEHKVWDEIITYVTPTVLGGNSTPSISSSRKVNELIELHEIKVRQINRDLRISGKREK